MTDYCTGGVTKQCRNKGPLCPFHAAVAAARERCESFRCRVTCTRGGCWRKWPRPSVDSPSIFTKIMPLGERAYPERDACLRRECPPTCTRGGSMSVTVPGALGQLCWRKVEAQYQARGDK